MKDQAALEVLFKKHGYEDYRWIKPENIVVSQWVRMKCMFGCNEYGHSAVCPPNVPSVAECAEYFSEYTCAAIFHFTKIMEKPEDRFKWTKQINLNLLELEREVFLSGYHKALLLFMDTCNLCNKCSGERTNCKKPKQARPSSEAMAVDVFATARKCGYSIEVLEDYTQKMNRFALLMIE